MKVVMTVETEWQQCFLDGGGSELRIANRVGRVYERPSDGGFRWTVRRTDLGLYESTVRSGSHHDEGQAMKDCEKALLGSLVDLIDGKVEVVA